MGEKYQSGLISVIIPTYNRADCISKAIDSVLAQSYKDYEIIVVDDGSTDNTKEVLQLYVRDNRIRYIHQENEGCASARNTGIHASCGRWIAFLDSDDRWHPEYLERQMNCLAHLPVEVCFTNVDFDYDGKKEFSSKSADFSLAKDVMLVRDPLDLVMTMNELETTLQGMLITRKLLKRMGGFDERFCWGTDMRLMGRLAAENPVAYINRKLVILDRTRDRKRLTKDRDMNTAAGKGLRIMNVLTYAEIYFCCRNQRKKVKRKVRRALGAYTSSLAVSCCIEHDNYDARRYALDGIYFGRDLRTYAKCAAVLFCPWLVRRIHRRNKPRSEVGTDI
jgi:glycosyltransferase involved in cell wall biosynthesis